LNKFVSEGAPARSKDQIGLHRVFEDPELNSYVFRRVDLMEFLDTKHFYKLKPKEIKEILVKLDGHEKRYYVAPGNPIRCWILPIESVNSRLKIEEKPDEELLESFSEFQEVGEDGY